MATALTTLLMPPDPAGRAHRSAVTSQRSVWNLSGPLERAFEREERGKSRPGSGLNT
jgi:hypothetical protein